MEDDEIIIGIEKMPTQKKKNKKSNNKNKSSKRKKSSNTNSKKISNKNKSTKNNKRLKVLKALTLIILLIVATILILCSSLFNIKQINVKGNKELSEDKIISLSGLEIYTNTFKFRKIDIKENLKENAYIEDVVISRKLPATVEITIKERTPNYMLQFADSYVYINNQGYMLEISNEKLSLPILIGFTTDLSNIKAGNRINAEDLKKMNMVIKIYENLKNNNLGELVTKIDISNEKNYTLILEDEGKTIYLGDASDLNTRILYLKAILDEAQGKRGEIFLNVDLNSQKVYFRERID